MESRKVIEMFYLFSKVPAFLNVVDIAGLVKGAAEGQGLGNAFLSHIKACDAVFHMLRKFYEDIVNDRYVVFVLFLHLNYVFFFFFFGNKSSNFDHHSLGTFCECRVSRSYLILFYPIFLTKSYFVLFFWEMSYFILCFGHFAFNFVIL